MSLPNQEKQADEILALQAILETNFRFLPDPTQYEILIEFDLAQPFYLRHNGKTAMIHSLPPVSLIIHYHDAYPSDSPPYFLLSCFYLSQILLNQLCQKLDHYPFIKGEVCVYDWIELIRQEMGDELILGTTAGDKFIDDVRALNGYSTENIDQVYQYLIHSNTEQEEKQRQQHVPICLICNGSLVGTQCLSLNRCRHTYCQACLNTYIQMALTNVRCIDRLVCPQIGCHNVLRHHEMRQIMKDSEVHERYERITSKRAVYSLNDASEFDNGKDYLVKELYSKDNQNERSEKQRQRERRKLAKKQEKAQAESARIVKHRRAAAEREIAQQAYREITIDLLEEDTLLEAILNAERLEAMNTQLCPNCHVRIEKDGGCPAMQCTRCFHGFTWAKTDGSNEPKMISFLYHFPTYQSISLIRDELNKMSDTAKVSEEDGTVVINNRSFLGSAIVKRVKSCPNRMCQKLNVKLGDDNWIVCEECLEHYCFLCMTPIKGAQHFNKNCNRHT